MTGTPLSPCISWQPTKDSATKTEHVIIAPSGMCNDDLLKCHLQVKKDGKKLIFSSQWPAYSMDMEALHCKLENKLASLPKTLMYTIFGSASRPCQMSWLWCMHQSRRCWVPPAPSHYPSKSLAKSISNIELLGSHDGRSCIIYVDLKAEESMYHSMEVPKVVFMEKLCWATFGELSCRRSRIGVKSGLVGSSS